MRLPEKTYRAGLSKSHNFTKVSHFAYLEEITLNWFAPKVASMLPFSRSHVRLRTSEQKFSAITILHGIEFRTFLLIFARALRQAVFMRCLRYHHYSVNLLFLSGN